MRWKGGDVMASRSTKPSEVPAQPTNPQLEVIDPIYQKYVKGVIRALGSTEFYEFFMGAIATAENEFQVFKTFCRLPET